MARPNIPDSVFIAPGAVVCGNVTLGENCSVYFNATLRADRTEIVVEDGSNIQDNCVLHASPLYPVHIMKNCSIGHGAIIHGCTIHDNVLVGMGAIIMNGADIGENSIIGAGTLITQKTVIPPYSVVVGSPGRVLRRAEEADIAKIKKNALHYMQMSREHMAGQHELAQAPGLKETDKKEN